MPRCSLASHLTSVTPIAAYVSVPVAGRSDPDRYRLRLCPRHGHELLTIALKRGSNLVAEQPLPEFCLSCATPTASVVYELRWYEGDWSLSIAYQLCEECGQSPLNALFEGVVDAEKLPPRDKPPTTRTRRR